MKTHSSIGRTGGALGASIGRSGRHVVHTSAFNTGAVEAEASIGRTGGAAKVS